MTAAVAFLVIVTVLLVQLPTADGRVFSTQMSPNTVETQYGRLRGLLITLPHRSLPPVEAYFGIQYASLHNGDLRFMPPTSTMEKWDGTRVFHKFKPVCPQRLPDIERLLRELPLGRVDHFKRLLPYLDKQNEECLYLNIYVPGRERNETSSNDHVTGSSSSAAGSHSQQQPLPVVVFIHGETYDCGTGNAYDGSVMAALGNVIVVTLNYRLGPLGFLSTGDSNAPGNYALLDQIAALHWIKDNIASFSGDPNSVTLLGHGYGAALVNLLLISPVTRGRNLFHRAILHGGSALTTWSMTSDPLHYARQLAERLNCSGPTSDVAPSSSIVHTADLLNCLKQKPAEELANVDIRAPKYQTAFGPTIDRHSVLPHDITRLMIGSKGSLPPGISGFGGGQPSGGPLLGGDPVFSSVRLLIGLSRSDAALYLTQRDLDEGLTLDRWRRVLRTYVQNAYQYHRQYIFDVLAHQYTDWDRAADDLATRRDCLLELLGDALFVAPGVALAQRHAALQSTSGSFSTFLYSFTYSGGRASTVSRSTGASYFEDMSFAFGAPITDGLDPFSAAIYSPGDKLFSENIIKYWTNFVKTGNPNEPRMRAKTRGSGEVDWPPYELEVQQLLQFERKSPDRLDDGLRMSVGHHYRGSKMALWLELIPKLHKSDNLDPRYHQLDNWDNLTTFEEHGTQLTSLQDLLSTTSTTSTSTTPPTTSTSALPTPTSLGHPVRRQTTTSRLKKLPPTPPSITSGDSKSSSASNNADTAQSQASSSSSGATANAGGSASASGGKDVNTLSLSVTIAVGSFLLFLNILIFVAVYYQKDRIRQERRRRKAELASIHQHEESLDRRDSACSDLKSNASYGLGSGQAAYHLQQQQQSQLHDDSAMALHQSNMYHVPPAPPALSIGSRQQRGGGGSFGSSNFQNCSTLPPRLHHQQQHGYQSVTTGHTSPSSSPSNSATAPNQQQPHYQMPTPAAVQLYGTVARQPSTTTPLPQQQQQQYWSSRSESASPSSHVEDTRNNAMSGYTEGRRANGGLPSVVGGRRSSGLASTPVDATELQPTSTVTTAGNSIGGLAGYRGLYEESINEQRNPTTIV